MCLKSIDKKRVSVKHHWQWVASEREWYMKVLHNSFLANHRPPSSSWRVVEEKGSADGTDSTESGEGALAQVRVVRSRRCSHDFLETQKERC